MVALAMAGKNGTESGDSAIMSDDLQNDGV
jgi:hypothetical protein